MAFDPPQLFLNKSSTDYSLLFLKKWQADAMLIQALPVTTFMSAVVSILFYWGALQYCIRKLAWLFQVVMETTAAESLNATCNIFLGPVCNVISFRVPVVYLCMYMWDGCPKNHFWTKQPFTCVGPLGTPVHDPVYILVEVQGDRAKFTDTVDTGWRFFFFGYACEVFWLFPFEHSMHSWSCTSCEGYQVSVWIICLKHEKLFKVKSKVTIYLREPNRDAVC